MDFSVLHPNTMGSLPSSEEGLDLDRVHKLSKQQLALVVDDDPDTVQILKLTLQREGINVIGAFDGHEALVKCAETHPNIILLDLMMPVMDGWEIMEQLREITSAPVLVISAINHEDAVVRALANGAEDYVRKPFSAKEVVARVKVALRRAQTLEPQKILVFPRIGLRINLETRQVNLHNELIKLSLQEYLVLTLLAQQSPHPVTYKTIGEKIWGKYNPQVLNRMKWVIHQLRRKLRIDGSKSTLIINYRRYGYKLSQ